MECLTESTSSMIIRDTVAAGQFSSTGNPKCPMIAVSKESKAKQIRHIQRHFAGRNMQLPVFAQRESRIEPAVFRES
jgi:hypothetical protein